MNKPMNKCMSLLAFLALAAFQVQAQESTPAQVRDRTQDTTQTQVKDQSRDRLQSQTQRQEQLDAEGNAMTPRGAQLQQRRQERKQLKSHQGTGGIDRPATPAGQRMQRSGNR